MSSDLSSLCDAVCQALRRHATAVLQGSDDRRAAGPALIAALDDYGAGVAHAGGDLPEGLDDMEAWLDEEDGIDHLEREADTSDRVAVFVRADLAVDDLEKLRANALAEMQSCCPMEPGEDPSKAVRRPPDAVAQLWSHNSSVFDPEQVERHGLRMVAETLQTAAAEADALDDEDYPWGLLCSHPAEADP